MSGRSGTKACAVCGSNARIRFDRAANAWKCVTECARARTANLEVKSPQGRRATKPASPPWRKREALFSIWVKNPETNEMTRATRDELREANRIWFQHRDIREGRVNA